MPDVHQPNTNIKLGAIRLKSGNIGIWGRLSFPDLLAPGTDQNGKPTKPGCTVLTIPNYDHSLTRQDLDAAWEKKWGTDPKKWPKGRDVRMPADVIRDATEKDKYAGYLPGWHFLSARVAKIEQLPGVVDGTKPGNPPVTDPREIYAGRWVIISVNAFGYDNVSKGVSLGLNNVRLMAHDDVLGGAAARPETDFDGMAEEADGTESAMD